ncbi:MAG: 1-aminocyclopropane-1-carboxylate deaminase/D-cysteine desulfhydrase [Chitinophagaceae bacterium]|nr:1-aminocyclopropane-1-carboxylate deaminase/D-cysteine desulfhydrase [Chitinophagaceae bacterium]
MLFDTSKANIEELHDELFAEKQVSVSVLRLDKIHPLVSGNKLFKLHYFLEESINSSHPAGSGGKTVLTFGGAYSNHFSATAYACKVLQLKSVGIVRGEKPEQLSHTLQQCLQDGMQLQFISRQQYIQKDDPAFITSLKATYGECVIIPEGGYHPLGAKGAALIMDLVKDKSYTHICTATGTATTLAGILMAARSEQTVVGFPVLKGITDIKNNIIKLTEKVAEFENLLVLNNYHFGGYAKKTDLLIQFMNQCWLKHQLPLDFVYTAKMLFGTFDAVKNDTFTRGSKILCLHTGGLQGNKSLPLNTLLF